MPTSSNTALRKRQQIERANRTMFFWVAGASAIVGTALVLSITLYNKFEFNQRIITEQGATVNTVTKNVDAAKQLVQNGKLLNTNKRLLSIAQASSQAAPLQVILDALPSSANRAALGASLQDVLLKLDGVTIESLIVEGSDEPAIEDTESIPVASPDDQTVGSPITFSFTAKATSIDKLFELLARLESSIRPIKINSFDLDIGQNDISLSAKAESYYQPAVGIDLGEKPLAPGGKGK